MMLQKDQFTIEINQLKPLEMTEDEWNQYHTFRKFFHNENNPDTSLVDDQVHEKNLKDLVTNKLFELNSYNIFNEKELIGTFGTRMEKETSPHFAEKKDELFFRVSLLKDWRHLQIYNQVLKKISEIAKNDKRTFILTDTSTDEGKQFLRQTGAKEASVVRTNKLDMKDIDWDQMKEWVKEAETMNPNLELKLFTIVPEGLLKTYCEMTTFIFDQMPHDDLQSANFVVTPESHRQREAHLTKNGSIEENAVILDKNKKIVGLSTVEYYGEKIDFFQQGLTGVLFEHRGKKLGK